MPTPKLKINRELLQLFGLGDVLDDRILLTYQRQLITAYQKAQKSIVGQISAMYERYGDDVSYDEMVSFNRLTNLEREINDQLNSLGVSSKASIRNSIKDSYQTSYQYSGFTLERTLQAKMGFGLLSEKQVQAVLLNPLNLIKWTDSEKANIIATQLDIRNKIVDGLIQGKGFSTTASEVKESLNTSFNRSMRIIQTETHRVQTAGRLAGMDQGQKAIDELGMESERMWLPTLDARTRPNHGAMDGKPAKVQEDGTAKFRFTTVQGNIILVSGPGLTGTTDDINCRCTVFIQFDEFPINVRKDNETKKIIPQKNYNDWYKKKYGKAPNVPKAKTKIKTTPKPKIKTGKPTREFIPGEKFVSAKYGSAGEIYAKNFAQNVDYRNIPIDQVNKINRRLHDLYSKYPKLQKLYKLNTTRDAMANASANGFEMNLSTKTMFRKGGAEAQFKKGVSGFDNYVGRRIRKYKNLLKVNPNDETLQLALRNAEKEKNFSRWSVMKKGKEIESTITHEMGHVIDDQLSGFTNLSARNGALMSSEKAFEFNRRWQRIMDGLGDEIYKISEYAGTEAPELFAESFTMYQMGERSMLPKSIISYLDDYLEYLK